MAEADEYCLNLLSEEEGGVYPALLFLPERARDDVAALYAFHHETAQIANRISEPLPGEIRLQWWREVLAPDSGVDRSGEGQGNPLAKALLSVISKHDLPLEGFERYLEARLFDLYHDVMPDRTALEAYFGETESFILQMASQVCGFKIDREFADACGHGGVAIGIIGHLQSMPVDRAAQRSYLPADLLSSAGLDRETWLKVPDNRHEMAVAAFTALFQEHMAKAEAAIGKLPKQARAIFLPVALARADASGIRDTSLMLLAGLPDAPLKRQMALWKAAIFGIQERKR